MQENFVLVCKKNKWLVLNLINKLIDHKLYFFFSSLPSSFKQFYPFLILFKFLFYFKKIYYFNFYLKNWLNCIKI